MITAWEKFKMAIMPESHAESVVNEIYGVENKGMLGIPSFPPAPKYDPKLAPLPHIIAAPVVTVKAGVSAAGDAVSSSITAVKNAADAVVDSGKKTLTIVYIALLLAIAVYAFVGRR